MEGEYRGSAEERRDLLGYYKQFKGDMDKARACHALQNLQPYATTSVAFKDRNWAIGREHPDNKSFCPICQLVSFYVSEALLF